MSENNNLYELLLKCKDMENNNLPLPEYKDFSGKKYILRVVFKDKREDFLCDKLDEISNFNIPHDNIKRAIVYSYMDRKNITCGIYGSDSSAPYWNGGVYSYRPHFERDLKKFLKKNNSNNCKP